MSFTSDVRGWADRNQIALRAVAQESCQRIVAIAQTPSTKGGNMPIDTGFLRASVVGALNSPVLTATAKPNGPTAFQYDGGVQVETALASLELGDVFHVAWTANYAIHVEYGARGRPGRAFARSAISRWQTTVAQVAAEARARGGAI
jgi:hypothetical protein